MPQEEDPAVSAEWEAGKAAVRTLFAHLHPTCIDVSTIEQGRGTAWVCGPDCPAPPHDWQEYNAHGSTCHYPGCALTEEEHR